VSQRRRIAVVGLVGGTPYGPAALDAIGAAQVVVGSRRHLDRVHLGAGVTVVPIAGSFDGLFDRIAAHDDAGEAVCVLASGDPGFFGIVRMLDERFGADRLAVHPAPSSVALAFAAMGRTWDDAVIASAHGRPLPPAVRAVLHAPKAAVLTSPDNPPEAVGKALRAAGATPRDVAVVTRIGEADESITRTDLDGLADGTFDPMSVVVLLGAETGPDIHVDGPAGGPGFAFGLAESSFDHRDGMITKAEVRAVVLAKLALGRTGVLWDIGAGSGSVAVECARLSPGLEVIAIERDPDQAARVRENAAAHGVSVEVIEGAAPDALAGLSDPDRVFVGGGGLTALDAARDRLRPGGVIVANYALIDRAAAAYERLGHLVQLSVARGAPVGGLGVRLEAENPVFVCWGPDDD